MSTYGLYAERSIKQLCDFSDIKRRVSEDINRMHDYLLTYEYIQPNKTDDLIGFVNMFNLNIFNFIDSLLETSPLDNNKKIGYNSYSIRKSTIGDTSNLLEKITNKDILKIIKYIKTIETKFSKNYYYFQSLLHLYHDSHKTYPILNRYYYDFIYNYDIKFPYENTFFFRIFNPIDETLVNKSYILYIIFFNILRDSVRSYNLNNHLHSYFDSNRLLIKSNLQSDLNNFLTSYIDDFAEEFYKFVVNNNIFVYYESDHFKNHVTSVFKEFINNHCRFCYNSYIIKYTPNTSFLAENIESNFASHVAYQALIDHVYRRLNINYFDADLLYVLGLERYMYLQLSIRFRDYYREDLEQVQYIITQWKDNPLFYINTQLLAHHFWITYKFNMDDYKSFIFPDIVLEHEYDIIDFVLDKINITSESANDLATLLMSLAHNSVSFEDILTLSLYDEFLHMVSDFVETDTIISNIVEYLIPRLVDDVRQDYYLKVESYNIVDAIKLFLKSYFSKHIVNGILFSNTITNIYNDTSAFIGDITITGDSIIRALNRQRLLTPNFYNFIERYFFSVRTTEYINDFLAQFEVNP